MTIQEMLERKAELGYSNAVLAEISGVPLSTVQKVLGGFTLNPRRKTLRALENALRREQAAAETEALREAARAAIPKKTGKKKAFEILKAGRRAELIDGQFYSLPMPSPRHQEIIARLLVVLANHFAKENFPEKILLPPFGVFPDGENGADYFEPDLMVVSRPELLTETGCMGAPDWVLEVASPATKFRDYTVKPVKYRAAGVRECWIADPAAGIVIVYGFDGGEEMNIYAFGEEIPFRLYPGLTAKLPPIR